LGDDPSAGATEVKILNTDQIMWNGQPVAVVVADTKDSAEYAASLIRVTYALGRRMNSFAEAVARAKRPQHILAEQPEVSNGDPDAVLKAPPCRVDLHFETPPHNHNATASRGDLNFKTPFLRNPRSNGHPQKQP
jgi:xanthine dehydrogenase YagR molybdenum-binding subunit